MCTISNMCMHVSACEFVCTLRGYLCKQGSCYHTNCLLNFVKVATQEILEIPFYKSILCCCYYQEFITAYLLFMNLQTLKSNISRYLIFVPTVLCSCPRVKVRVHPSKGGHYETEAQSRGSGLHTTGELGETTERQS